jgi:hypothetical protein
MLLNRVQKASFDEYQPATRASKTILATGRRNGSVSKALSGGRCPANVLATGFTPVAAPDTRIRSSLSTLPG